MPARRYEDHRGDRDGQDTTRTAYRGLETGLLCRKADRRIRTILSHGRGAAGHYHVHAGWIHVGSTEASRAAKLRFRRLVQGNAGGDQGRSERLHRVLRSLSHRRGEAAPDPFDVRLAVSELVEPNPTTGLQDR